MRCILLTLAILLGPVLALLGPDSATVAPQSLESTAVSEDPSDWPMYNRDVIGTRFNTGEKALGKDNVGQLVQKWRFPPADAKQTISVVHATVPVRSESLCDLTASK